MQEDTITTDDHFQDVQKLKEKDLKIKRRSLDVTPILKMVSLFIWIKYNIFV